jgi:predicted XRE-type DNA-binding protein
MITEWTYLTANDLTMRQKLIRQIELLLERKQALITAAVTGQLDLTRDIGQEAS